MRLASSVATLVVGVATIVVVSALAPGCPRPCETADNCKRTCDCVDTTTDTKLECSMAFRCETNASQCEAKYDAQACADVCNEYAAIGKCGFQRCVASAECVRVATCPIRDANGQPTALNFQCTLNFDCDTTLELCDPGSEVPLDQLCLLVDPATGALVCPQPPV